MKVLPFPKPKKNKDPEYLNWIKTLPCCITNNYGMHLVEDTKLIWTMVVDPHHVNNNRSDDRQAIPICRHHHSQFHGLPKEKQDKLLQQFSSKFDKLVKKYNNDYELTHGGSNETKGR